MRAVILTLIVSMPSVALANSKADRAAGAPPPAPRWALADYDAPLTVSQEGVFAMLASYQTYDSFYEEPDGAYRITVRDSEGVEIPGETTWTSVYGLLWRASSGELEPPISQEDCF